MPHKMVASELSTSKRRSSLESPAESTKTPPARPRPNTSHPCFLCGLMFAKQDDFEQHTVLFHKTDGDAESGSVTLCDQCGKTCEFDPNSENLALGRHQLEHDLAVLVKALYEQEIGLFDKKEATPIRKPRPDSPLVEIVQKVRVAPMVDLEADLSSDSVSVPLSAYLPVEALKSDDSTVSTKNRKCRPISPVVISRGPKFKPRKSAHKRVKLDLPPTIASFEDAAVIAAPSVDSNANPNDLCVGNVEKPIHTDQSDSNAEYGVKSIQSETGREENKNTSSGAVAPKSENFKEKLENSLENQKAVSSGPGVEPKFASNNTKGDSAQAEKPATTQTPMLLRSTCPHCGKNEGKPWLLVDHMIKTHGAKLIGLERTTTDLDGLIFFENFEKGRFKALCQLCGENFRGPMTWRRDKEFNSEAAERGYQLLAHILSQHHGFLFGCPPDVSFCEVRLEVLSTACELNGPLNRKFTMNVKIKRKPTV